MKIQKIAKGIVSAAAALAMMMSPALAATNDTAVVNSGDDAQVSTTNTQSTSVNVNNNNDAYIKQTVNATSNTGKNDSSRNIGGGSVTTGTAAVGVTMDAVANKNVTAITGLDTSSVNNTDVVNTGDDVNIDTNTSTNTRVNVNNNNDARVSQYVYGKANTGYNTSDRNIGGGSVDTGNATVGVALGTAVNSNQTFVGGNGGTAGLTNATSVTNTGDDARVDTDARSTTRVNVNNNNYARIAQYVNAKSNSGLNTADRNIGGGSVDSGNAGVGVTLGVRANSNVTGVGLGSLGGSSSNNFSSFVNTGDDLNGDTDVTSRLTLTGNNNNALTQLQSLFSQTNSGLNVSSRDIGGGAVDAGNAFAGSGFSALANSNVTLFGGLLGDVLAFFGL